MRIKGSAFSLEARMKGAGEEAWQHKLGSNHPDVLMRIARKVDTVDMEQRIVVRETGKVFLPPERLARGSRGR